MKNSGIPYSSLPPRLQAQVTAQLATAALRKDAKPRLRQSSKGPNKTEAAFEQWLRANMRDHHHHPQGLTFRLANGVRYTPDFASFSKSTGYLICHEVKGHMRDDAAVKLKVAAGLYPGVCFRLVTRRGRTCGGWDIQQILL